MELSIREEILSFFVNLMVDVYVIGRCGLELPASTRAFGKE
jgi:hypothetical protein